MSWLDGCGYQTPAMVLGFNIVLGPGQINVNRQISLLNICYCSSLSVDTPKTYVRCYSVASPSLKLYFTRKHKVVDMGLD